MHRLAFVVLGALACTYRTEVSPDDFHSSDAAVYRAVLDSIFIRQNPRNISQLVVQDSTSIFRRENLVHGVIEGFYELPGVDSAAVRDFEARSREHHPLGGLPNLRLRVPVVLIDNKTLHSFPQRDAFGFWEQFYLRYPGSSGTISLSAIGYSANGDLAILMVDQGCGSLCGNGYMVAVRREGGVWRVTAVEGTWVS